MKKKKKRNVRKWVIHIFVYLMIIGLIASSIVPYLLS